MASVVWLLICIVYVVFKFAKLAGKTGGGTAGAGTSRTTGQNRSTYTRNVPQKKSFAAMPKQESGVPNVERNCSAEEKHRFENNISGHSANRSTAVPNVPNANRKKQPKMSGNRKVARQLYMGDPVPRGSRIIVCSYCAAENIVPANARNEYKCYFCHYDI